MASFTGIGDNTTLAVPAKGETVDIAISGTYSMEIKLQLEQGSLGSGSWQTLRTWDTEDATVAYTHTTRNTNEQLRLIVTVDTSGTATATLTESSVLDEHVFKDKQGNTLLVLTQKTAKFFKGIRRAAGAIVNLTDATLTALAEDHAGRVVTCNKADGITITLPAATGTGDVYAFFVETTATSDLVIQAASASDSFGGGVAISTDIAGITMLCAATTDTCTMNGTTTGGVIGSWIRFTDVAAGKFMVEGFLVSTGTEATPWSAAVS